MRPATLPPAAARRGFTLVELLVAAALCVLVMYVLAQAFKAGTDTLSQLKSVAGLAEQLRSAETIMRRDLSATHLEDDFGNAVSVSDKNRSIGSASWAAPNRGFFKIAQPTKLAQRLRNPPQAGDPPYDTGNVSNYLWEGRDSNSIDSVRATDHWMQLTCKLNGRDSANVFTANAPVGDPGGTTGSYGYSKSPLSLSDLDRTGSMFVSTWGEVTYFLAQSNAVMPADATNPLPLFLLCRRARVLAPPGTSGSQGSVLAKNPTAGVDYTQLPRDYPDLSVSQGSSNWTLNGPDTVTDPAKRLGPGTNSQAASYSVPVSPFTAPPVSFPTTSSSYGTDLLLTNVVSMRIQPIDGDPASTTLLQQKDVNTGSSLTWDTFSATNTPNRILGVQIQLRVYDTKNLVTRQVTIAQAL